MSQNVIQFKCAACQATLTVPVHMAGVSGPCPKCGATVTSPSATQSAPLSVPMVPDVPAQAVPPSPSPLVQPPAQVPIFPQPSWTPPATPPPAAPNPTWGAVDAINPNPSPQPSVPTGFGGQPPASVPAPQIDVPLPQGAPHLSETPLPARRLPERQPAGGSLLRQVTSGVLGTPPSGRSSIPSTVSQQSSAPSSLDTRPVQDDPMAALLRGGSLPTERSGVRSEQGQPLGGSESPFPQHLNIKLGDERRNGGKFIPALVILLLLSGLGFAGWYFLEPVKKLAQRYFTAGSTETPTETKSAVSPEPTVNEKPPAVGGTFDPGEKSPPAAIPVPTPPPVTPPSVAPQSTAGVMENAPKPQIVGDEQPGTIVEVKPALPTTTGSPPTTSNPPRLATAGEVIVKADPQAESASKALLAFFAAPNLTERLKYTLGAPSISPLMTRYYEKMADGVIEVSEISLLRYDQTPETGGGAHCVFTVTSKLWEFPIPVMLQEEGGTFKVDWLAFVEFRDNLLFTFLSEFQETPARFHVGIRRTHYFEDDVPDLEEKDCFEIQPPLPTYVGYVFVPKKTPLAADLAGRISWETSKAYVIVELRWRKEGNDKWVELTGVPQLNWYSFQLGAKPSPGAPKPTPSKSPPVGKK